MDWRADRIGSAEQGENPTVLARMRTGWAVIGDTQHLPGYCLLLYAGTADHLTDLPRRERAEFLFDVSLLGEAVQSAASAVNPAFRRINYEILGNTWHHLHGHVHARYEWEPQAYRSGPVWRYGNQRQAQQFQLDGAHEDLQNAIRKHLNQIVTEAYRDANGETEKYDEYSIPATDPCRQH